MTDEESKTTNGNHSSQKYFNEALNLVKFLKPYGNPYYYSRWGRYWFDMKYGGFITNLAKGLMYAYYNSEKESLQQPFNEYVERLNCMKNYYQEKSIKSAFGDFNLAARVADEKYPKSEPLSRFLDNLKQLEEKQSKEEIPSLDYLLFSYSSFSINTENEKKKDIREYCRKMMFPLADKSQDYSEFESTIDSLKNRGLI